MASKKNASAFQNIIAQVKGPGAAQDDAEQPATKKRARKTAARVTPAAVAPLPQGKRGGKSSDPDYTQATLYIRKDTHHKIKVKLLTQYPEKDMSDLAEELFDEWLSSNS